MKNLLFILLLGLGFSQIELTTRVYELPTFNFNGYSERIVEEYNYAGYFYQFLDRKSMVTFGALDIYEVKNFKTEEELEEFGQLNN